jgi:hypothetical protein
MRARQGWLAKRSSLCERDVRLRGCAATADNLRVSVTESSPLLGDPTVDETDAKLGLPSVARCASATSAYAAAPLRRTTSACR